MFLWDDANTGHIARHNVSCQEAEQVLNNHPLDIEEQLVESELRWMQLGETDADRVLIVISTMRGDDIRVVTAFEAEPRLRRLYHRLRGEQYGQTT